MLLGAACSAPLAATAIEQPPAENTATHVAATQSTSTVPAGPTSSAAVTANPLAIAPTSSSGTPAPWRPVIKYIVQAGDTCAGIAMKFRTTLDALIAANPPSGCDTAVGRVLQVPRSVPYDIQLYEVQSGDTFASIAAAFGFKLESLLWSNPDLRAAPDSLTVGEILYIPPVDGAIHLVQDGDMLVQIAIRYHVIPKVIADYPANDLPSTTAALLPGSLLVIPGGRLDGQDAAPILPTPKINSISSFRYAPDGRLLVVTERLVELLDPATQQVQWSASAAEGCCAAVAMSGSLVGGIGAQGGLVVVWDTATGQELFRLTDSAGHFSTLALSRDGGTLATGEFGQIRLWDAHTGQPRAAWATGDEGIKAYPWTAGITNLAFALDDQSLFSANSYSGQVIRWDAASDALLSSFVLTNTVNYDFTPDATQILADFNQYGFELRNIRTGALQTSHDKIIGASGFETFSGDGQRIAVWGYNTDHGSMAAVWQLATDTLLQQFSVGSLDRPGWRHGALSPDGGTLALSDEHAAEIVFFDVASGKVIGRYTVS